MNRLLQCLFASLTLLNASAQDVTTNPAQALLKQMEAKYAAMKSYQDTISAQFRNPDGSAGANAECKVWFSRPNFFRIDGETRRAPGAPPRREVIWSDGESTRAWSTARVVTVLTKIQLAGSKMFGTYAYHVPTLIERTYGGKQRLHELTSSTLVGEETIDGVVCHRIRGTWLGDPYEVWLGKDDLLVRKITADYKGYAMEELHRDIVVDQPIQKRVFQFAPEEEAAAASPAPSPASSRSPAR